MVSRTAVLPKAKLHVTENEQLAINRKTSATLSIRFYMRNGLTL